MTELSPYNFVQAQNKHVGEKNGEKSIIGSILVRPKFRDERWDVCTNKELIILRCQPRNSELGMLKLISGIISYSLYLSLIHISEPTRPY